jgi:hypothetical protein
MRTFYTSAAVLWLGAAAAMAQNQVPQVNIQQVLADTVQNHLTVTYTLSDAESDAAEVSLSLSIDGGVSFEYAATDATGDVGYPVQPGALRTAQWTYPDSIAPFVGQMRVMLTADDHQPNDIQPLVDMVDTVRMAQNLSWLQGIRHRTTGAAKLQWVRDTLQTIYTDHGLSVRQHAVPFGNYSGMNLVGRKPGLVYNASTYILQGHYDTVDDSPGADDNASAWAGLLEVMRIIRDLPMRHSVQFIAFDLEESGLLGSEQYVVDGIMPYEDIAGVINADMIGYYTEVPNTQTFPAGMEDFYPELYAELVANEFRGNFIISTPNGISAPLGVAFDSLAAIYVPDLLIGTIVIPGNGELIPDARRSDHAAFWDAGYRALHISDGADSRNPNYHGPGDTLGTVTLPFAADVTKAILALVLNLAEPIHADSAHATVAIDPQSGIAHNNPVRCAMSLSPNPTSGCVKVNVPCATKGDPVDVTDASGRPVLRFYLQADGTGEVDLSGQRAGTYVLSANPGGQRLVARAVVRK